MKPNTTKRYQFDILYRFWPHSSQHLSNLRSSTSPRFSTNKIFRHYSLYYSLGCSSVTAPLENRCRAYSPPHYWNCFGVTNGRNSWTFPGRLWVTRSPRVDEFFKAGMHQREEIKSATFSSLALISGGLVSFTLGKLFDPFLSTTGYTSTHSKDIGIINMLDELVHSSWSGSLKFPWNVHELRCRCLCRTLFQQ